MDEPITIKTSIFKLAEKIAKLKGITIDEQIALWIAEKIADSI